MPTNVLKFGDPDDDLSVPNPRGTIVLLIAGDADPRWAADAAIELSAAWARAGRRIVLADLHLEAPLLHADLGVPNIEGIVDIFQYGASLSRIARPVREGAFYLIPAGTYAPDVSEIYRNPRWKKLVAGFRDTGAVLALFVPAGSVDLDALAHWSDEAIFLGQTPTSEYLDLLCARGIQLLAVLEPDRVSRRPEGGSSRSTGIEAETISVEPDSRSGARIGNSEDDTRGVIIAEDRRGPGTPSSEFSDLELELPPPPSRRRRSIRRGPSIILWVVFAIILMGTAAYLIAMLRPELLPGDPLSPTLRDEVIGANSIATSTTRVGDLIPYSVQVKAFTSLDAASEELEAEQRRIASTPFFISPEEIQGILYYRILAGFVADTVQATRLRDDLVEWGAIDPEDVAGAWSLLQFTPVAFDLGEFDTEPEAMLYGDSLRALGVPTYLVGVPYSDGSRRWQVYGGAFRDSVGASRMRQMMEAIDIEAPLVPRSGIAAPVVR